jgi:hypothetical protein
MRRSARSLVIPAIVALASALTAKRRLSLSHRTARLLSRSSPRRAPPRARSRRKVWMATRDSPDLSSIIGKDGAIRHVMMLRTRNIRDPPKQQAPRTVVIDQQIAVGTVPSQCRPVLQRIGEHLGQGELGLEDGHLIPVSSADRPQTTAPKRGCSATESEPSERTVPGRGATSSLCGSVRIRGRKVLPDST